MEALLREYKDEICDLKYRNSCLALEIDTLHIEMKELHQRATAELQKKDSIIKEQEESIEKSALMNDAELNRLARERADVLRVCDSLEEEVQEAREEGKRFVGEVVEQLAVALNMKHNKELPQLLARTKQLRMQHDQLLLEHQKTTVSLELKEAAMREESPIRQKLEVRCRELQTRCKELENQLALYKLHSEHNEASQLQIIAKLREECRSAKDESQSIRSSGQALHVECQRLRSLLEGERVRYASDMEQQTAKLSEMQEQATEMREQLDGIRSSSRAAEIEEEIAGLLDKIRVRKQTKIKNMLSEKFRRFGVGGRAGLAATGQRDNSSIFQY